MTSDRIWKYETLGRGYVRETELELFWELDGDPLTDDYLVEEITPLELWRRWRGQGYPKDSAIQQLYGAGASRIWWFVSGDQGVFEGAPLQDNRGVSHPGGNFLDYFTWPVNAETGERLRWSELPVADKLWRPGRADKGGFIQELTGWKPSPLQPFVNVLHLERMAGLV